MFKSLAIFVVLSPLAMVSILAVAAQEKPPEGTAKDKGARIAQPQHKAQYKDQDTPKTPPLIAQIGSQQPAGSNASEEKEAQRLADYTWWLTTFTAVLALVSIAQGYFLYRQARHLQEHAGHLHTLAGAATDAGRAAQDAAKAALKQAGIMANAERAWIVETVAFPDQIPRRGTNWHGGVITAVVTIKNIGRQPAMLQFVQARFHTAERLSNPPEYHAGGSVPDGFLLAPGEDRHWRCMLEEGSLGDEQINRIEQGSSLHLYIYGRVIYTSMGISGVNQFCYIWQNLMGVSLEGDREGFRKDGPDGYNRHS